MTITIKESLKKIQPVEDQGRPPELWIADPITIDAATWVLVDTGKRVSANMGWDNMYDASKMWHSIQKRELDSEIERPSNEMVVTDKRSVLTGGGIAFLNFFPADGETVYLKSNGALTEQTDTFTYEPPAFVPDASYPFRFVGSSDRTSPYTVGPFTRGNSVWIYSTASIQVLWSTFLGRNTGVAPLIGG